MGNPGTTHYWMETFTNSELVDLLHKIDIDAFVPSPDRFKLDDPEHDVIMKLNRLEKACIILGERTVKMIPTVHPSGQRGETSRLRASKLFYQTRALEGLLWSTIHERLFLMEDFEHKHGGLVIVGDMVAKMPRKMRLEIADRMPPPTFEYCVFY